MISSEWLSLAEALKRLGKSQSTLERLVLAGAIRSKLEPRPGRKPERLYTASDVAREAAAPSRVVVPVPVTKPTLQVGSEAISSFRDVMTEWLNRPVNITKKIWLTVNEARELTGFTRRDLGELVAAKELNARRSGRKLLIQRASLEAFEG